MGLSPVAVEEGRQKLVFALWEVPAVGGSSAFPSSAGEPHALMGSRGIFLRHGVVAHPDPLEIGSGTANVAC